MLRVFGECGFIRVQKSPVEVDIRKIVFLEMPQKSERGKIIFLSSFLPSFNLSPKLLIAKST
jgi:hypothetical protein